MWSGRLTLSMRLSRRRTMRKVRMKRVQDRERLAASQLQVS
jgi:hypothetical protein